MESANYIPVKTQSKLYLSNYSILRGLCIGCQPISELSTAKGQATQPVNVGRHITSAYTVGRHLTLFCRSTLSADNINDGPCGMDLSCVGPPCWLTMSIAKMTVDNDQLRGAPPMKAARGRVGNEY